MKLDRFYRIRQCRLCEEFKPREEFPVIYGAFDDRGDICKTCLSVQARERIMQGLGERICDFCERSYTYRTGNQRFCSKQCRELWYGTGRFTIFARDGFRCFYCGRTPAEDGIKLHIDHVIPHSKGGKNEAGNLVTACEDCNLSKNDRLLSLRLEREVKQVISRRNHESNISDKMIVRLSNKPRSR